MPKRGLVRLPLIFAGLLCGAVAAAASAVVLHGPAPLLIAVAAAVAAGAAAGATDKGRAAAADAAWKAAAITVTAIVLVAVGSARSRPPALTGACIRRRSEGRHTGPHRGVRVPAMPADRLPLVPRPPASSLSSFSTAQLCWLGAGQQRTAAGADRPERSPALGGRPSAAWSSCTSGIPRRSAAGS